MQLILFLLYLTNLFYPLHSFLLLKNHIPKNQSLYCSLLHILESANYPSTLIHLQYDFQTQKHPFCWHGREDLITWKCYSYDVKYTALARKLLVVLLDLGSNKISLNFSHTCPDDKILRKHRQGLNTVLFWTRISTVKLRITDWDNPKVDQ